MSEHNFQTKFFSLIRLPLCNSANGKLKFTDHWLRYSSTSNVTTLTSNKIAFIFFAANLTWSAPGRVAQSVTCLATDASLTADPGVASLIPARSHTFVEIDHKIFFTVILLPSAESFKKGCCQLQAKVCARSTG